MQHQRATAQKRPAESPFAGEGCPPDFCAFDATGVCVCGKRKGPHPYLARLDEWSLSLEGGLTGLELDYADHVSLGLWRQRHAAEMGAFRV